MIPFIFCCKMTHIVVQNDAFHNMISGILLDKLHHFGSSFGKDCSSISRILVHVIGLGR